MTEKFPYLQNRKSLEEIRKHKWIESEKKGRDIGFATAALDWINKHGKEWRKYHVPELHRSSNN